MTWLCRAEPNSLRANRERIAWAAGIIREPGKPARLTIFSKPGGYQLGQEKKQSAELSAEPPQREIEATNIGDLGHGGACPLGAFLITSARQSRKSLFAEDLVDAYRAELSPLGKQGSTDVVDGEVLFAQLEHLLAKRVGLGSGPAPLSGAYEELPVGVAAKSMDQKPEAALGVSEALGGFLSGTPLHDKGSQGLALAVGGGFGLEKKALESCYIFAFTV